MGDNMYYVTAEMKVPKLVEKTTHSIKGKSLDVIKELGTECGLGFATNVENTSDEQAWNHLKDKRTIDFMREVVSHSYFDDESFFDSFIDQFYVCNFAEVNRIFFQGGDAENVKSYRPTAPEANGVQNTDEMEYIDEPYMLTNRCDKENSIFFFKEYQEVDNAAGIADKMGYKKTCQYFDLSSKDYVSETVDPLTTNTEGFIPITKGNIDGEDKEENIRDQRITYRNTSYSENAHKNYDYAEVLNTQNLHELDKCGLDIVLDTYNAIITKYSRIKVEVWEANTLSRDLMLAKANDKNLNKDIAAIPQDEREPLKPTEPRQITPEEESLGILNESLSSWYIVTGIRYTYTHDKGMRTHLRLRRRERKPLITNN